MYVLVSYDIVDGRTEKFRKILSKYLTHEHKSVFSGDMTESKFIQLKKELVKEQIAEDSILTVTSENRNNVDVSFLIKNDGSGHLDEIENNHHKKSSVVI